MCKKTESGKFGQFARNTEEDGEKISCSVTECKIEHAPSVSGRSNGDPASCSDRQSLESVGFAIADMKYGPCIVKPQKEKHGKNRKNIPNTSPKHCALPQEQAMIDWQRGFSCYKTGIMISWHCLMTT